MQLDFIKSVDIHDNENRLIFVQNINSECLSK